MLLLHGVEARGFLQTMELFGELDRELLNRGIAARPVLDQIFDLAEHEWMTDWADDLFNEIIEELVEWF